jgi:DNA modification methylase
VRLVTPVDGTVLDPYMRSGSTGKAADIEGLDFVGIDDDKPNISLAWERIGAGMPLLKN